MRMKAPITKRLVDATAASSTEEVVVWDTEVKGFGLRCRAGRAEKTYFLKFRTEGGRAGRQRWATIGVHGSPWTPDAARKEAKRLLAVAAGGKDPAAQRDEARRAPTVAQFAARYLAEYAVPHKKPSSVVADRSNLKLHILPALGHHKLASVTRADVVRLHLAGTKRPTNANRTLALLSHMFTTAERWGLVPQGMNPCRLVERFKEVRRERFLSDQELARVGRAVRAAQKTESPFALAGLRLLIFTGARLGEVLSLRWADVDLKRGAVRLADSKTGAKTVLLNAPARKVLGELPRIQDNPFVIAGRRHGAALTHSGLEHTWARVRTVAKLEDVRVHDLRHTYGSVGVGGNLSLRIIGALLGHASPATTQRYAHVSTDPLRKGSDAIGARLSAAMGERRPRPRAKASAARSKRSA